MRSLILSLPIKNNLERLTLSGTQISLFFSANANFWRVEHTLALFFNVTDGGEHRLGGFRSR